MGRKTRAPPGGSCTFRPSETQSTTLMRPWPPGRVRPGSRQSGQVLAGHLETRVIAWLPESCNGMKLRCRFLSGQQCEHHLTFWSVPLLVTVECAVFPSLNNPISFTSLLSAPPPSVLWLAAAPSAVQDPCHSPRCKPRQSAWADRA